MRDIAKVVLGIGAIVGVGILADNIINKHHKKETEVESESIQEFRCVRDARFYDMIVRRFNGDSEEAILWIGRNYEYPYNYSKIYEDIKNGVKDIHSK